MTSGARPAGRLGVMAWAIAATSLGFVALSPIRARAVPAFAVQTGRPCEACHVGGFGPQLTPFGREFKLRGYTLRSNTFNIPVSAMAVTSYVRTAKDNPGPVARHYASNDNVTLDQASLFLAGGVGTHLGGFVQATYDGVHRNFHWDNLDLRAVTTATVGGVNVVLGASFSNAPTTQDAFNTLAAWGYPYTSSGLAPTPAAGPLIGGLAQTTLGLTSYAWINSEIYLEAGGYQSPGARFLTQAGVDAFNPGAIRGTAPYARIAWQKSFGQSNVEVGAYGLWASLDPGRDETTGLSDSYADTGVDASVQLFPKNKDVITVNARYTHEDQRLNASQALGLAQSRRDRLDEVRADVSYYWRNQVGLTVGAFDTWGSTDSLLYAGNRTFTPDSSGLLFQLDGTPWGAGGSPLGPRFNLRVGMQYTLYTQFDGARSNFDNLRRNASDNDTFRLFTWIAY